MPKINIEFTQEELEVLCGALAHMTPADKSHEVILFSLYLRIRQKLDLIRGSS